MEKKIKIGLVTYSHPAVYPTTPEREDYVKGEYQKLHDLLAAEGFAVEAPLLEMRKEGGHSRFGIWDPADLDHCIQSLQSSGVRCLIVQLNQWTRISLITNLIKALDVPFALFANSDGAYPGEVTASAAAASILEMPFSKNGVTFERFRDSESDRLISWLKAVTALQKMRDARVMCWGGFYGADIPYTRDDDALLENILVKEILVEQEMVIMKKAENILKDDAKRVQAFIQWLKDHHVEIQYDRQMLTEEALQFQIGQYFAVKDRLQEMQDENIQGITIKCHFEVSTDCVGCTECLIPAFLPFFSDSEGAKGQIPVGCEGDLKGLLTSMMMTAIDPKTPVLFGDIITYQRDYVLISNCGSASVYWAARSNQPEKTLPKVRLVPQVHGRSGSAVFFFTPEGHQEAVTFARLFRAKGRYYMYLGTGEITQAGGDHHRSWPVTKVRFPSDPYLLFRTSPANHGCLAEGDLTREIEFFCRQAGIRTIRCDQDQSLKDHIDEIASF